MSKFTFTQKKDKVAWDIFEDVLQSLGKLKSALDSGELPTIKSSVCHIVGLHRIAGGMWALDSVPDEYNGAYLNGMTVYNLVSLSFEHSNGDVLYPIFDKHCDYHTYAAAQYHRLPHWEGRQRELRILFVDHCIKVLLKIFKDTYEYMP